MSDLLIDFTAAADDAESGLKCVIKAESLERVEKESLLTCTHSLVPVCHYTYATQYRPSREEECGEYYHKTCRIVFSTQAVTETVRHCHRPVERQCGAGAQHRETAGNNTTCRDLLETECTTRYQPTRSAGGEEKHVGITACRRVPLTLCGDADCDYVEGAEECHDEVVAVVNDVPEESCDLVPNQICKAVHRLVPYLKPVQECREVRKEITVTKILPEC